MDPAVLVSNRHTYRNYYIIYLGQLLVLINQKVVELEKVKGQIKCVEESERERKNN